MSLSRCDNLARKCRRPAPRRAGRQPRNSTRLGYDVNLMAPGVVTPTSVIVDPSTNVNTVFPLITAEVPIKVPAGADVFDAMISVAVANPVTLVVAAAPAALTSRSVVTP